MGWPAVTVRASGVRGPAPLQVTLTASGDATSYAWDLGDGTTAAGPVVKHSFQRGGAYRVAVTGRGADGETTVAAAQIAALHACSLRGPRVATYGRSLRVRGRIAPAAAGELVALRQEGEVVARTRTKRDGSFVMRPRFRSRTPFTAEYENAVSPDAQVVMRPLIRASLIGSRMIGRPLVLSARVVPAAAGKLRVLLFRSGRQRSDRTFTGRARLRLDTRAARRLDLRLTTGAVDGFAAARKSLRVLVRVPPLSTGRPARPCGYSSSELVELRFALPGINGSYGVATYEAVLAFQKLHGIARTGRVTPALWSRLQRAPKPRPRYGGGTHIEVDKTRQILFDVEEASCGGSCTSRRGDRQYADRHLARLQQGSGFQRPVDVLLDVLPPRLRRPRLSLGPPYPASHGCVRTPLWIAPTLYAEHGYGSTVHVYY